MRFRLGENAATGCSGGTRIRTWEGQANRFTAGPLWPLEYPAECCVAKISQRSRATDQPQPNLQIGAVAVQTTKQNVGPNSEFGKLSLHTNACALGETGMRAATVAPTISSRVISFFKLHLLRVAEWRRIRRRREEPLVERG